MGSQLALTAKIRVGLPQASVREPVFAWSLSPLKPLLGSKSSPFVNRFYLITWLLSYLFSEHPQVQTLVSNPCSQ